MANTKRKYYSQLVELLRKADVAIEVVDSRFIKETKIEKLECRFQNKLLIVASKSDLVPKEKRELGYVYFSARTREGINEILDKAVKIGCNNPYKKTKEIKMMIFGIPNVGKSSLINALRKKYVATTGFLAGITRGPQWIRLSDEIMLCDSAGVVNLHETEESMVLKNALDVTKLKKPEQIAAKLINSTGKLPNPLFKFYNILKAKDAEDVLIQIAKKRGLLEKKGVPNVLEAAKMLLRDYQKGKFLL